MKVFLLLVFAFCSMVFGTEEVGKRIFEQKCSACHTIGMGRLVGPDLKGVVERRDLEWLKRFIKSPTNLINEKDSVALSLLKEYGTPMPDLGLTNEEVDAVVQYLKSPEGGKPIISPLYYLSLIVGVGLVLLLSSLALLLSKKSVEVKA